MDVIKSLKELKNLELDGLCNEFNDQLVLLRSDSESWYYRLEGTAEFGEEELNIIKEHSLERLTERQYMDVVKASYSLNDCNH